MFRPTSRSFSSAATRRAFVKAGGLALAGLATGMLAPRAAAAGVVEIRMKSDVDGSRVWFDPVGVFIEPGTAIRWVIDANVHTSTAYHPANDDHSLRIPEGALPWDSGFLVNPGDRFEVTLTVEGVYDYFCAPHEMAGMVGRIVVGRPAGPGTLPFGYFEGDAGKSGWRPVPEAARKTFPSIERIVAEKRVRAT